MNDPPGREGASGNGDYPRSCAVAAPPSFAVMGGFYGVVRRFDGNGVPGRSSR